MARPLKLEFSGALYHITSRGDRREDIFLSDDDRSDWLAVVGLVCARFNWVVHAFCQMTNHYHLLVETVDGNLSRGMRQLNGLYMDWLLGQFGSQRSKALKGYRQFVMAGRGLPSPMQKTRHQLLLGDDAFVERHRQTKTPEALREVSKAHRRLVALSLDEYRMRHPNNDEAMAQAYLSGAYTMAQIGQHFGVHYMTVSRAVRKFEQKQKEMLEC